MQEQHDEDSGESDVEASSLLEHFALTMPTPPANLASHQPPPNNYWRIILFLFQAFSICIVIILLWRTQLQHALSQAKSTINAQERGTPTNHITNMTALPLPPPQPLPLDLSDYTRTYHMCPLRHELDWHGHSNVTQSWPFLRIPFSYLPPHKNGRPFDDQIVWMPSVRYDAERGRYHILFMIDDWGRANGTDTWQGGIFPLYHQIIDADSNERRTLASYVALGITCFFDSSRMAVKARISTNFDAMFELVCDEPLHPRIPHDQQRIIMFYHPTKPTPPTSIEPDPSKWPDGITQEMGPIMERIENLVYAPGQPQEATSQSYAHHPSMLYSNLDADAYSGLRGDIRVSTVIPVCSSIERVVEAAYCGPYLHSLDHTELELQDFIQHYAVLGIEKFVLFQQSPNLYEKILEPYINGGLVQLIHFPSPWPKNSDPRNEGYYYLQILVLETCRQRMVGVARWIGNWDFDEWIIMKPAQEKQPQGWAGGGGGGGNMPRLPQPERKFYPATCLNQTRVVGKHGAQLLMELTYAHQLRHLQGKTSLLDLVSAGLRDEVLAATSSSHHAHYNCHSMLRDWLSSVTRRGQLTSASNVLNNGEHYLQHSIVLSVHRAVIDSTFYKEFQEEPDETKRNDWSQDDLSNLTRDSRLVLQHRSRSQLPYILRWPHNEAGHNSPKYLVRPEETDCRLYVHFPKGCGRHGDPQNEHSRRDDNWVEGEDTLVIYHTSNSKRHRHNPSNQQPTQAQVDDVWRLWNIANEGVMTVRISNDEIKRTDNTTDIHNNTQYQRREQQR